MANQLQMPRLPAVNHALPPNPRIVIPNALMQHMPNQIRPIQIPLILQRLVAPFECFPAISSPGATRECSTDHISAKNLPRFSECSSWRAICHHDNRRVNACLLSATRPNSNNSGSLWHMWCRDDEISWLQEGQFSIPMQEQQLQIDDPYQTRDIFWREPPLPSNNCAIRILLVNGILSDNWFSISTGPASPA